MDKPLAMALMKLTARAAVCGIVAKQDDKETAHQDEQRRAGRVGDLDLITAGDELTAIPEAAGRFRGHDKNGAGGQSHDPAHDIVHTIELHSHSFVLVYSK